VDLRALLAVSANAIVGPVPVYERTRSGRRDELRKIGYDKTLRLTQ
jgi:hypothetical protein